ncbi:MAG: hypothetical protein Q9184_004315 [Pyrenodesmia sp. 2 TL-2023]
MESLQQARLDSFFKPRPKTEEELSNLKRKNEANTDVGKKKQKKEAVPPTPPSIEIHYVVVYKDQTEDDHDPDGDGTITICSTSDSPHPEDSPANMIPCIARFRYGVWEAEFETNYCTASDTFDKFELIEMNDAMGKISCLQLSRTRDEYSE